MILFVVAFLMRCKQYGSHTVTPVNSWSPHQAGTSKSMAQLAQEYDRVFDGVDLLGLLDTASAGAEAGHALGHKEVEQCSDARGGDGVKATCLASSVAHDQGGSSQPHEWFIWRTGHYLALRSHGLKIQVG